MGLEVGAVWVAESWKCQRPKFYKEEWAWPWGPGRNLRVGSKLLSLVFAQALPFTIKNGPGGGCSQACGILEVPTTQFLQGKMGLGREGQAAALGWGPSCCACCLRKRYFLRCRMGLEVGAVWLAESWKCRRPFFLQGSVGLAMGDQVAA